MTVARGVWGGSGLNWAAACNDLGAALADAREGLRSDGSGLLASTAHLMFGCMHS